MDTGPLGRTGQEGEEGELPFMRESIGNAWSSALGWVMSHELRDYGSGLEGAVAADVCYRPHDQEK